MLRLLLIALALVSGCSCSPSGGSPDAAVPEDVTDVSDSTFLLDASPRDPSLPCEGTVAILPVELVGVPDAWQRFGVRAAREGDGLVLGWQNVDSMNRGPWLVARVRDVDAPRTELVAPLPLPELLGLYTTDTGSVRALMTEAEDRGGASRGGWADLQADGTFGELHLFAIPTDLPASVTGDLCAGTDAVSLRLCAPPSPFAAGASIMRIEPTGASFFEPGYGGVLGTCSSAGRVYTGPMGCVSHSGVTSVLMAGSSRSEPLAVLEWRPDGTLLHTEPVELGTTGGDLTGIVGLDAEGPIYFAFVGSPAPTVAAYSISGGSARMLDEHALAAFPDLVVKLLGTALLPDTRLMVVYSQSWVLSVVAFDRTTGFGDPVIVSNGAYEGGAAAAVALPSGVYLPLGGDLSLLRLCGG